MQLIEFYSFGKMVVNGITYTSDVMILPQGQVIHPWWRQTGHVLCFRDLNQVVAADPEIIVAGTGQPGMMKPGPDLERQLAVVNIDLIVQPTASAVDTFNQLKKENKSVAGGFHLSC